MSMFRISRVHPTDDNWCAGGVAGGHGKRVRAVVRLQLDVAAWGLCALCARLWGVNLGTIGESLLKAGEKPGGDS